VATLTRVDTLSATTGQTQLLLGGIARSQLLVGTLGVLLVLTGAAGLIYQVVWFRILGLVFGITIHATSAVLAAFMAGLALGSFIAGRRADRLHSPLRTYGVIEVLIGLAGLASLPAFDALQPVYRWVAGNLTESDALLSLIRFVLAFAIMLVPTTLMGATLPIVVKSSLLRSLGAEQNVSLLYAANTTGAILGTFLAGFVLIGLFGLTVATGVAAALNVAVGVGCVALAAGPFRPPVRPSNANHPVTGASDVPADPSAAHAIHTQSMPPPTAAAPAGGVVAEVKAESLLTRTVLVVYGLSGALALAYEVVWTRMLGLVFPQTVYAFSIMLCAVLAGIAAGSWAISPFVNRRANWAVIFGLLEAAIGIAAVLSLTALAHTYNVELLLRRVLGTDRLLLGGLSFMSLHAFLTIFPSAFLMGAAFPVAAKLYGDGRPDIGRRLGTIYGANVLGAIAGSLLAGMLFIPLLGSQLTVWLLGASNVLLGLAVLAVAPAPVRAVSTHTTQRRHGVVPAWLGTRPVLATLCVVLLAGAAALTPDVYQRLFANRADGAQLLWRHEGEDTTAMVLREPGGNLVLYTNSQPQARDVAYELAFHRTLGHFAALLHPRPREGLVIGLGGGAAAGAAATYDGLRLTVAELHPGVVEAARQFSHVNYRILDRPNVNLVLADGRNYLLLTRKRYDVIQADIIPPGNAGGANLYAADYYRLARNALADGGLMVQWIDRQLPEYQYKLLLRTFLSAFPHATLWVDGSIVVGSLGPLRIDPVALEAKFQSPETRAALEEVGLRSVGDVLERFVAHPHEIAAYVGDGPIITDRHPMIEYGRTLPSTSTRPDLSHFSRDVTPTVRRVSN
jgi:spermidine synthase